jgi:hypothetical protein
MTQAHPAGWTPRGWAPVGGLFIVALTIALLGETEMAEEIAGVAAIWASFRLGRPVTIRLALETDPTRILILNAMLVGVVLLALVGVGLIAAPIQ